ncbi:hypothetical protein FHT44_005054 [Mycolicibacterium sp. BK634]|uniref:hypothetical protein n=1 Tax=Mycolicibacterium sp. BK634 TaxID=2587099 RepID=UPI001610AA5A|nr:hypothetical protein [Mycolicibacterium sp. BK634]MBB3752542.1 hypothetical protein [Mycolicibacterium sp. BK634]
MTAHQEAFRRELESANAAIRKAGALMTEDDGFQWIDESKMPAEFLDYYSGLVSAGYAIGAI